MGAAVKGGFWEQNGVSTLDSCHTTKRLRRIAAQALNHKSIYGDRESMRALNGVAPGGALYKSLTRVTASQELGGVRPIEEEVFVFGTTNTAVRDQITKNFFNFTTNTSFGSNPPPNLDGNPLGTR